MEFNDDFEFQQRFKEDLVDELNDLQNNQIIDCEKNNEDRNEDDEDEYSNFYEENEDFYQDYEQQNEFNDIIQQDNDIQLNLMNQINDDQEKDLQFQDFNQYQQLSKEQISCTQNQLQQKYLQEIEMQQLQIKEQDNYENNNLNENKIIKEKQYESPSNKDLKIETAQYSISVENQDLHQTQDLLTQKVQSQTNSQFRIRKSFTKFQNQIKSSQNSNIAQNDFDNKGLFTNQNRNNLNYIKSEINTINNQKSVSSFHKMKTNVMRPQQALNKNLQIQKNPKSQLQNKSAALHNDVTIGQVYGQIKMQKSGQDGCSSQQAKRNKNSQIKQLPDVKELNKILKQQKKEFLEMQNLKKLQIQQDLNHDSSLNKFQINQQFTNQQIQQIYNSSEKLHQNKPVLQFNDYESQEENQNDNNVKIENNMENPQDVSSGQKDTLKQERNSAISLNGKPPQSPSRKERALQFPSMLFDDRPKIEISGKIRKKYLVFRVYEDPIQIRPYQPPDRGYYFDMRNCDIKIIRYTLEDNGFRELPSSQKESSSQSKAVQPSAVMGTIVSTNNEHHIKFKSPSLIWYVCSIKNIVYQGLQQYQKINHFPCSFYITKKDLMFKTIAKLREIHGFKHFTFLPKTYVLPNEFQYLQQDMVNDQGKLWIFKPAAQSQGRGIFVTSKISEIPQRSSNSNYVVCEYISNPLLINGYKFDMRIYVAITSINPLRIYIYEEGLARFATCKYAPSQDGNSSNAGLKSKFMHLTNYSINKKNINFQNKQFEINDGEGFKWSLTALKKLMQSLGINEKAIWKQIEDIVIKTIISAEPQINQACEQYVPFQNNCFELLGFDILIDDLLQCWLLEVNLSPSLGCDSSLDQKIKGNLLADLFTLMGIVPFEQRKYNIIDKNQKGMYSGVGLTLIQNNKLKASKAANQIYSMNPLQNIDNKPRQILQQTKRSKNDNQQQDFHNIYCGTQKTEKEFQELSLENKIHKNQGKSVEKQSQKQIQDKIIQGNFNRKFTKSLNKKQNLQNGQDQKNKQSHYQFKYEDMTNLSREEQILIREVEDEFKRRCHFKRIFPSIEYSYYKQFFLNGERPLNKLIDEKIMEKRRMKTAEIIQMQNQQLIKEGMFAQNHLKKNQIV